MCKELWSSSGRIPCDMNECVKTKSSGVLGLLDYSDTESPTVSDKSEKLLLNTVFVTIPS